jgi:hypothetical protein
MTLSETALSLAIATAPELDGRLVAQLSPAEAHFELTVDLLDGSSTVYQLLVTAKEQFLTVKERVPEHLPAFCPQRHINYSGSFCLGWGRDEDLSVTCQESARAWWSRLHRFLVLQVRAANKKIWPGKEWAHGSTAAIFQQSAEQAASKLGPTFTNALQQGKLKVVRKNKGGSRGPLLQLFMGQRHLCSVWGGLKMVANKRQPCICAPVLNKRIRRIRSCNDHAHLIKVLVLSLHEQEIAVKEFWDLCKGQTCCGTMKNCPLAN